MKYACYDEHGGYLFDVKFVKDGDEALTKAKQQNPAVARVELVSENDEGKAGV